MPWTCAQCSIEIGDDAVSTCPDCGHDKTSWTLVKDRTRRLVVGKKRFVCEHGTREAPVDGPLAERYDADSWVETEVAPAIPTAEARRLAEAGQGPAPRDVLRVVQLTGNGRPSAVELTVLPDARASRTTETEARSGPPHDVRYLLVFGEDPQGLTFDGLEVVDVTDDGPLPHAPQLEVVALLKRPKLLRIEPRDALDWDLFTFDVDHPTNEADEVEDELDWELFSFTVVSSNQEEEAAS
jgi:hypothetical protein